MKYVGGIKKIYHNPKKATTVVISDSSYINNKVKVKRDAEDPDDIYMAVASALMIRKFGSNSAVKAYIRKILPRGFEGRPQTYQIIVSAGIGDMFGSWEKFCKVVDEKLVISKNNKKDYEKGKMIDKLRREGMKEKDIVSKLNLKGIAELRRLRADFVEAKREVSHGRERKKTESK